MDGVAFEGGKAEHYGLVLGSGSFIPGFEDQVIGHEAGEEFDVNVTFPEEYQAKELAGKAAVFKIKLHEVKTKELPALDDEFAKDVSEFDTLDELKARHPQGHGGAATRRALLWPWRTIWWTRSSPPCEGGHPRGYVSKPASTNAVRDFEYRLRPAGLEAGRCTCSTWA